MTEQQKATTADELANAIRVIADKDHCYVDGFSRNVTSADVVLLRNVLQAYDHRIRATPQPSPQRDEESTAQEAAPVALRAALISCARMFQTYVDIHVKKGDEAKAARNREMVELCNRALAATDTPASAVAEPVRSDAAPVAQEVSDDEQFEDLCRNAERWIAGVATDGSLCGAASQAMRSILRVAIATKPAHTASTAPPFDTRSPCGDPNVTVAARDAVTGEPTMTIRKHSLAGEIIERYRRIVEWGENVQRVDHELIGRLAASSDTPAQGTE